MAKKNKIPKRVPVRVSLNAVAILVAFVGLSFPVVAQSPADLISTGRAMVAATGATLTVGVAENPYNTLAQQLTVKQLSLQEREAQVDAREAALKRPRLGDIFGFASFVMSILLLVLIGLNFYMDWRRGGRQLLARNKFQVDLR